MTVTEALVTRLTVQSSPCGPHPYIPDWGSEFQLSLLCPRQQGGGKGKETAKGHPSGLFQEDSQELWPGHLFAPWWLALSPDWGSLSRAAECLARERGLSWQRAAQGTAPPAPPPTHSVLSELLLSSPSTGTPSAPCSPPTPTWSSWCAAP